MVDFTKMAREAKAKADADAARRAEEEKSRKAKAAEKLARCTSSLVDFVLPTLKEAKTALSNEAIEMRIETKYDRNPDRYVLEPQIKIHLLGPARQSDKHKFETIPAFFIADEDQIEVGVGEHPQANRITIRVGQCSKTEVDGHIEKAVKRLIEDYHEKLEDWFGRGLDKN